MQAASSDQAPLLEAMAERINQEAADTNSAVYARIVGEGELNLYVLIKDKDSNEADLNAVVNRAVPDLPSDWTDHRNGNNIALMPPTLGKQFAVEALLPTLRTEWPDLPVIGIGDSITDAPFMALCDFAMTPTGGQLARTFARE